MLSVIWDYFHCKFRPTIARKIVGQGNYESAVFREGFRIFKVTYSIFCLLPRGSKMKGRADFGEILVGCRLSQNCCNVPN